MEIHKQSKIGSQYIADDLGITRRTANHIKDQESFPPVMWIGRQWRVDYEAYEAWKVLCYENKGAK